MTADLALAADPGFIERSADPGEFIIQACERAKTWLREALENGDIDQIAELKSQAEAVRVYTMQKQLGKDAQLSATEIVRRAERGIGTAIRRGQAEGSIGQKGGRPRKLPGETTGFPRPVTDFASYDDLRGNGAGIYDMTDGISDEDFEAAVTEARAEGALTRANVVRKLRRKNANPKPIPDPADRTTTAAVQRRKLIREYAGNGYSSRQIGELIGINPGTVRQIARNCDITIGADAVVTNTRHLDSSRIVRETVHSLEALAMGIELADAAELDPAEAKDWAVSMSASIRVLSRFTRQIKEIAQ